MEYEPPPERERLGSLALGPGIWKPRFHNALLAILCHPTSVLSVVFLFLSQKPETRQHWRLFGSFLFFFLFTVFIFIFVFIFTTLLFSVYNNPWPSPCQITVLLCFKKHYCLLPVSIFFFNTCYFSGLTYFYVFEKEKTIAKFSTLTATQPIFMELKKDEEPKKSEHIRLFLS